MMGITPIFLYYRPKIDLISRVIVKFDSASCHSACVALHTDMREDNGHRHRLGYL